MKADILVFQVPLDQNQALSCEPQNEMTSMKTLSFFVASLTEAFQSIGLRQMQRI